MIVFVFLVLGLMLRVATGGGLRSLSAAALKGETWLLGLLIAQMVAPTLHLAGAAARVAFYVWLSTFPFMAGIAWINRKAPGMAVLGLGLLLNFAVIAANGGMPVFGVAVAAAGSAANAISIPASDFVHTVGTAATRLPWLADVIPLSSPGWLRLVASPGDLLLYAGIAAFMGCANATEPERARDTGAPGRFVGVLSTGQGDGRVTPFRRFKS